MGSRIGQSQGVRRVAEVESDVEFDNSRVSDEVYVKSRKVISPILPIH